jgi:hypothetical protein
MHLLMRRASALLLLLALAACNTDDGMVDPEPGTGRMSATIDVNTGFAARNVIVENAGGTLAFVGGDDTFSLGISFPTGNGVGVHTVGASSAVTGTLSVGGVGYTASGTAGSGSVTLTTLTATRAVGTFSFTVVNASATPASRQITNGSFDVAF